MMFNTYHGEWVTIIEYIDHLVGKCARVSNKAGETYVISLASLVIL